MPAFNGLPSDRVRKTALVLVSAGLLWNLAEAGASFWAGAQAGSVALFAFGLDSIVELFAGGVLVWRMRGEWAGQEEAAAERRAQRLIAVTFLLLAGYIGLHSLANLVGWLPEPEPSLAGMAIVVASAVVMTGLYVGKMRVAVEMQSKSLRAEAIESLVCDLQDLTVFVGLGLNALFSWWWADPIAALALIPFLLKEGKENLFRDDSDDDHTAVQICFCAGCFYGLTECPLPCCAVA